MARVRGVNAYMPDSPTLGVEDNNVDEYQNGSEEVRMVMKNLALVMLSCLVVAGCKTSHPYQISSPENVDAAHTKLTEAASSVSSSLHQLAEVEQAAIPSQQHIEPPDPASYGMDGIASVDWNGPIEPLVARVARGTNYQLKVLGQEPPIPVLISILRKNVTFADIIRDAGLQAGSKATIRVFPSLRVIELRYAAL